LEFAITFDSKPAEIGIFLRDYATRSLIWNFATGSFRSMTLLLRENYFVVCLSPRLIYELEITDTGGNGLNSTFVQQAVYGSFRLSYQHQLVTNYSGYCSIGEDGVTAELNGFSQCGNFCSCSYRLMENIAKVTGQCTTSCNTASTRGGTSP
jgi:hypothetical protein